MFSFFILSLFTILWRRGSSITFTKHLSFSSLFYNLFINLYFIIHHMYTFSISTYVYFGYDFQ